MVNCRANVGLNIFNSLNFSIEYFIARKPEKSSLQYHRRHKDPLTLINKWSSQFKILKIPRYRSFNKLLKSELTNGKAQHIMGKYLDLGIRQDRYVPKKFLVMRTVPVLSSNSLSSIRLIGIFTTTYVSSHLNGKARIERDSEKSINLSRAKNISRHNFIEIM